MRRRSTFQDASVTYGAVGATRADDLMAYPPAGFRPAQQQARLGSGRERFQLASAALMTLGVQRASGIRVASLDGGTTAGTDAPNAGAASEAHGAGESVFGPDGTPYVVDGASFRLEIPAGLLRVRAPVRVVYVIEEPDRVGFGYGTLPGHPLSGEESFAVEIRPDASVWLLVRSFSRPAGAWRLLAPFVRRRQKRLAKRYLRALLPGRA